MEKTQPTLRLQPRKLALWLAGISTLIVVFSLIGQRPIEEGNPTTKFFLDLFAKEFFVNSGENIATYWEMLLLILLAGIAFLIAAIQFSQKAKNRSAWLTLGILLAYFAVDELAQITAKLIILLQKLPEMEGGFRFNWLYPTAAAILLLLIAFLGWFYFQLNAKKKFLFPTALILYGLGAYRNFLFSGSYAKLHGETSTYLWLSHLEELAGLIGVILMIYFLLTYLASHQLEIALTSKT
ncbi:MAG: hypothetical protein IT310_14065 [Anaerolineales bacterium]|nr:hypothetical protein [Anaerolineales bacterium]